MLSKMILISLMKQSGVNIVKGIVQEVQKEKILLKDGTEIPYGLLVWSTGVGPSKFVNKLDLPKSRGRFVKQLEKKNNEKELFTFRKDLPVLSWFSHQFVPSDYVHIGLESTSGYVFRQYKTYLPLEIVLDILNILARKSFLHLLRFVS